MSDYISIPIGKGKYAVIDASDAALVLSSGYRWRPFSPRGSRTTYALGYRYLDGAASREDEFLHRLIMDPPGDMVVDHVDEDGLNCRRGNLQVITRAENSARRPTPRKPTRRGRPAGSGASGFRGVTRLRQSKKPKWLAKIGHERKVIYLGCFGSAEEAARAVDVKAWELFGDDAILNFPVEGE